MEGALGTRDIVWAVITIPAVAALCLIIAAKLQWLAGSALLSVLGAIAAGALVWWIGRRWLTVAVLIVFGLILIVFEGDGFDIGLPEWKSSRRRKLEQAIARREAMLRGVEQPS